MTLQLIATTPDSVWKGPNSSISRHLLFCSRLLQRCKESDYYSMMYKYILILIKCKVPKNKFAKLFIVLSETLFMLFQKPVCIMLRTIFALSNTVFVFSLHFRNNLTVFDMMMVQGHGAKELLKVGGKLPGPGASLRFNVPQSTLMECRDGQIKFKT